MLTLFLIFHSYEILKWYCPLPNADWESDTHFQDKQQTVSKYLQPKSQVSDGCPALHTLHGRKRWNHIFLLCTISFHEKNLTFLYIHKEMFMTCTCTSWWVEEYYICLLYFSGINCKSAAICSSMYNSNSNYDNALNGSATQENESKTFNEYL